MKYTKIASIEKVGYRKTYDIEVDNKSHNFVLANKLICSNSLAYSINAYISMYLKVHYPLQYYFALLNETTHDELSWFIKQVKTDNIEFNNFVHGYVTEKFSVNYGNNKLNYGFNIVKGMGSKDIPNIMSLKANNVYELAEEIKKKKIGKKTFETLCMLNYFSNIFEHQKMLINILNETKSLKKSETIKSKIDDIIVNTKDDEKNYTKSEILNFEKQYLGFYISKHPFLEYIDVIGTMIPTLSRDMKMKLEDLFNSALSPKETAKLNTECNCWLFGIINDIKLLKSKKTGKEYYKIILEDDEAQLYITVFNTVDIKDLNIGEFIFIYCSKNNFGFTKQRGKESLFKLQERY